MEKRGDPGHGVGPGPCRRFLPGWSIQVLFLLSGFCSYAYRGLLREGESRETLGTQEHVAMICPHPKGLAAAGEEKLVKGSGMNAGSQPS